MTQTTGAAPMELDDNEIAGKLVPARTSGLRAHHLPTIPAWYPLDREPKRGPDGEIVQTFPPYTDAQRLALRDTKRLEEACAGPYDGFLVAVTVIDGRPPRTYSPLSQPGIVYELDEQASKSYQLIYRYNPDLSPMHGELMRAVESGFAQAGHDYAIAAREETDHERTAPEL